jgi:hypothetical protein
VSSGGKRLWSYASACGLAAVTLFVFFVLQDFGPESSARRFNSLGNKLTSYIPGTVRVRLDLLRKEEAIELNRITTNYPNDPALADLLEFVREQAYVHASFEIVRLDYKTPTLAIAVIRYVSANPNLTGYYVWILELKQGEWRINPKRTQDTFAEMNS